MAKSNAYRQRVVESLIAAEVPEVLAVGIADVLAEAGFKQLGSCTRVSDIIAPNLVTPIKSSGTIIPRILRFPPISETLPTLILRHDQRIGCSAQKRQHNKYAYERLVTKNYQANALMLMPQDRVA
jgi:hypothetical protein